jgi:DNA-binding response OmpR family regulator
VAAPPADPRRPAPDSPSVPGSLSVPGSPSGPGSPAAPALAVLLAEHDPEVAELARRYLTRAGAHVTITAQADETTAALAARTVTVAVLDLTMPGLDARRLRRLLTDPSRTTQPSRTTHPSPIARSSQIAQATQKAQPSQTAQQAQNPRAPQKTSPSRLPTLFLLSASMRPRDLRVAAESCLWRPFSPRLLVTRVLAIAPRPPQPPDPVPDSVRAPEPIAPLTPAESALLSALATHPGHVLTRSRLQAIAGRSTPGHPASGRAIDVHVSQLRAKLPDPTVLRTIRGVGYILDEPAPPTGPLNRPSLPAPALPPGKPGNIP